MLKMLNVETLKCHFYLFRFLDYQMNYYELLGLWCTI